VGRYKETLYFSIVPTLYYRRTLALFLYGNKKYQVRYEEKYKLFIYLGLAMVRTMRTE